jgi:hypothetical protein
MFFYLLRVAYINDFPQIYTIMKIKLLPALLLVLVPTFAFSQTTGYYRFTKSGPLSDVSGEQYYNKSSWFTPSINSTQRYSVNAGTVVIRSGDAAHLVPVIETIKPVDCNSSGSVVLGNLPVGNWVINPGGIIGTGTNTTITGLAVGSYSFTVTNEFGIVSPATAIESIVITDKSSTTWTGTWSNGIPTINTNVILAGNYDMTTNPNITACSLTINTGVSLTITDEKFVAVQNNLTVNTEATLNIINEGSLVMISDSGMVANNGTIKVNITTALCEKSDYGY